MKTIIEKIRELHSVPYAQRLKPVKEVYERLRLLGYDDERSKKIMRENGVSRALLFKILPRHLPC